MNDIEWINMKIQLVLCGYGAKKIESFDGIKENQTISEFIRNPVRNPEESLEMFHPLIHEKNVTVNHIHVLEMSLQFRTKIPKESCESATGIPSELSIDYSWFIQLSFLLGKLMVLLPGNFGIQQRRYQRWSKVSRFLHKLVK